MRALINRPVYMEQLISFREKQIIKVVTGIRRCGKSTLFDLYCEYLRKDGVGDDQIIRINLEDPDYFDIQDYMHLYNLVKDRHPHCHPDRSRPRGEAKSRNLGAG